MKLKRNGIWKYPKNYNIQSLVLCYNSLYHMVWEVVIINHIPPFLPIKKFRYIGYPKPYLLTILFSIFLSPDPVIAAENINSFELAPEQLFSATVISASKKAEKVMDAPAAVYVISNEDIKRSGATSIPEALRMAPGVDVARVNTGGWAISIRGFNGSLANKLLILIDGREVYDPLFSGVYWDIQDVPLEDIERIEVIRGPGASLWGSNAVNGVINIISKSAFDTDGNFISAITGNKETAEGVAQHGGKLGDNGYYRIYGKSFYRENQQGLNGMDSEDSWKTYRGGFRADWKNDEEQSTFTLQSDAYHNKDSEMRNVNRVYEPFSQTIEEQILARGGNILGHWNKKNDDGSAINVASYFDYTSRNQALINDERATYDFDAQYELPQWNVNKFIVGGKYRLSNDILSQTEIASISFTEATRMDKTLSSFIQDKITIQPDKWFLTLGSKFENNEYTGFEIEPDARLQWYPDTKQMLWASISRAVRTPSRLENDLHIVQASAAFGTSVISFDTLPNPDLSSEELIAYEIGYRNQLTPDILLDIATFYNDYNKLITYTPEGLLFPPPRFIIPLVPLNNTSAKTYGAETLANWRLSKILKLSASYSLLRIDMDAPDTTNAASIEKQSPQHQFNIHGFWDINEKLSFDTILYYVSELDAVDVKSYTRLDMRIGYNLIDGIEFSLVGQNLLDNAHQEFTSPTDLHNFATEINRSIYGNITWRF